MFDLNGNLNFKLSQPCHFNDQTKATMDYIKVYKDQIGLYTEFCFREKNNLMDRPNAVGAHDTNNLRGV